MADHGPPKGTLLLLKWLLPEELRDEVLSELDHRFHERIDGGDSPSATRRWYRGQLFRAVIPTLGVRLETSRSWAGKLYGRMPGPNAPWRASDRSGPGATRPPWDGMARDIAFAVGQLRRNPGFTLVVILTLALGVGATTSVFSLVDAALLKPFPYRDAEQLVVIRADRTRAETNSPFMSGPDMMDIRREAGAFTGVANFGEPTVGPLTQVGRPEHVTVLPTSDGFFELLGVSAVVGNVYSPEASAATMGADTTVAGLAMLSHGLWQRTFGGDPGIVGRTVYIWGRPLVVSGVLPPDFHLRMPPDLNTAAAVDAYWSMGDDFSEGPEDRWYYRVVARLREGTTVGAANAELGALAGRLEALRTPNAEQGMRFRVESLTRATRAPVRPTLTAFAVAVGLVLLIACANVANLLLVRGAGRIPEITVRAALGAGRGRIIRQLLTECGVLSILGAGLGIGLAFAIVRGVASLAPAADLLQMGRMETDLRILAFAAATAMATTFLAGLLPALRITDRRLTRGLQHRGAVGGHHRFTGSLAVIQIALSMTLLAGVGLMFRTVAELEGVPLGFEPTGVLTATVTQPMRPPEERIATEAALLREAAALPGVQAAGIVFPLPMNGVYERMVRFVDDGQEMEPALWRDGYFRTISPGYLDAIGIDVVSGRDFTVDDESGEFPVVIVDEELAQRTWPGEDPLGKRVRAVGMGGPRDSLYYEVVGIVEYAPQWDHRDVQSTLYFPRIFYLSHEVSLALKVAGDPLLLAGPLTAAIRSVEDLPSEVIPMGRFVTNALGPTRFVLWLLGGFAMVAVGLTGVGLYGVLAYGVRQRTREIGVRIAMGAEKAAILKDVVTRGGKLALLGALVGLGGALALGGILRSHLYQVSIMDPTALLGTGLVIVLVAALASWYPARCAASVDPVEALRTE